MSPQFARSTGRLVSLGAAATVALKASVALAACQLPSGTTPGLCTYSGPGPALQITDPANLTATAAPSTFKGIATGTSGHGVTGEATGKNGVGGFFQAAAPSTSTTSTTALEAVNSGGKTSADGNYGSAGVFTITNAKNQSPGISITTNGINSQALSVVNSGTIDYNVRYVLPGEGPADYGGVAGYFEINNTQSGDFANQAAIFVVNSGGISSPNTYGAAGIFETTNPNNNSATLQATSNNTTVNATAMYAAVPGSGVGVWGEADGSGGEGVYGLADEGYGVYGFSASGISGYFWNGSGGNGHCSYDGGATWSCASPGDAMNERAAPNYAELLDKLDAMPVNYYRLKAAKVPERYLGPSAEDFRAAFALGRDDQTMRDGNAQGVALAAAQGLYRKLKADEATIAAQNAKVATQDGEIAALNAKIATLEGQVAAQQGVTDRLARLEAAMARLSPVTNTAMLAK